MKRPVLCLGAALILLFAAGTAFAEEQGQQKDNQQRTEKVMPRTPAKRIEMNDLNRPAGTIQPEQTEQLRQQARERMRQRAMEQRERAARADANMVDVNSARLRTRRESIRNRASAENAATKGPQPEQQMSAMGEISNQVEAKHRDRIARLNRIRELAQQQGDTETVARANKLLEKETKLYDAKTQRIEHRKEMIVESSNKAPSDKEKKQTGSEAKQDINQPPAGEK